MEYLAVVVFTITVTIGSYAISRWAFLKYQWPVLSPVFASTAAVIAILWLTGLPIEKYQPGQRLMTALLGPAVVALAVPLYRQRHVWLPRWPAVLVSVAGGSLVSLVSVVALARVAGFASHVVASLAPKSVTAPVAVEIARLIGGDPALTAPFVIATGMLGSMFGPCILSRARLHDSVARGLAVGTTAHGQGAAAMLHEGELQGALAGAALVLTAVITSVIAPFVVPWLVHVGR
jgi:predicted murein hydrolase (TIGR00659 family)